MLFSGGKDSAVMLHLAVKACAPARLPFPVMHIDTGHNFPEVIDYTATAGWPSWVPVWWSPACRTPSTPTPRATSSTRATW